MCQGACSLVHVSTMCVRVYRLIYCSLLRHMSDVVMWYTHASQVEEWFAKHGGQKRVFLATDEPDLLAEAKKK